MSGPEALAGAPTAPTRKRRIIGLVVIPVTVAALGAVLGAGMEGVSKKGVDAAQDIISPAEPKVTVLTLGEFDSPVEDYGPSGPVWPFPLSRVPRDLSIYESLKRGAVDADSTLVRLNLRGSGKDRITLQKVRVIVTQRNGPLRGVYMPVERGGNAKLRFMRADLDTGEVSWVNEALEPVPPKPIFVTEGEEENIDLVAQTKSCDCRWHLELWYTAEGRAAKSIVRMPGGKEFRTTSTRNAAVVDPGTAKCQEAPDAGPSMCG